MNFMKKVSMAALVLSASAFAEGHHAYYGLGFGSSQNNSTFNSVQTNAGVADGVSSSAVAGGQAFQGFGYVGVTGSISDMLRGSIQADIGFDGLNKTILSESNSSGSETLGLQSGFYYGASARLAVVRGDYAPYLLAGVRAGQWTTNVVNSSSEAINGYPAGYNVSTSKTMVSPELGIGINVTYTDELDGRMEYKYMFGSTGTSVVENASNSELVNTNSVSVRQQSVQFSLLF